ncbi:hypothetical protein [Micromonospora profundi]
MARLPVGASSLGQKLSYLEPRASIGSVGDALDNALMESIIGLYETD